MGLQTAPQRLETVKIGPWGLLSPLQPVCVSVGIGVTEHTGKASDQVIEEYS